MLGEQLREGVEAGLGVGQLGDHHGSAGGVDDRDREGVFVGVDSGEHATPSSVEKLARGRCSGAAHASAGCRSPRLYQASTARTPASVTGGHS
jgi:hypothetical protein